MKMSLFYLHTWWIVWQKISKPNIVSLRMFKEWLRGPPAYRRSTVILFPHLFYTTYFFFLTGSFRHTWLCPSVLKFYSYFLYYGSFQIYHVGLSVDTLHMKTMYFIKCWGTFMYIFVNSVLFSLPFLWLLSMRYCAVGWFVFALFPSFSFLFAHPLYFF